MSENILTVDNLSVRFGTENQVLDKIGFTASKGEFVSVLGPSGTGKTTLLNCIAGLQGYSGNIKRPVEFSYVFQDKSLFPWMTVKDNIFFGLQAQSRSERSAILADILEKVQMSGFENRYPYQLSGGQAQRIALARGLALGNSLILCDEPFSALDGITKQRLIDWFITLIDGTKTFLFVTHNIEDAILLSDKIIIMKDKHIAAQIVVSVGRDERIDFRTSLAMNEYKKMINEYLI